MKTIYRLDATQAEIATILFGLTVAITDIESNIKGMHPDDSDLIADSQGHIAQLKAVQQKIAAQHRVQQEASR